MLVCAMLVLLMTPGLAFFLRRFVAPQERGQHHGYVHGSVGGRGRAMGGGRLVVRLRWRRFAAVLRRFRPAWSCRACPEPPGRGGDGSEPWHIPGYCGRGISVGVRGDHVRHHHGCGGRPHEVRRGRAVRGYLGACGLRAACPHGLGRGRLAYRRDDRRAGFRRRRRGAYLLRPDGLGAVRAAGTAQGLWHDELSSAQCAVRRAGRDALMVRLVRVQCGFGIRCRRRGSSCVA